MQGAKFHGDAHTAPTSLRSASCDGANFNEAEAHTDALRPLRTRVLHRI